MGKKLIAGLIAFAALPFIAKAAPDMAFYLFIVVFAVIMILVLRRDKGGQTDPDHVESGPKPDISKRRRIQGAVRAVRKNKMTVAQASAHYNVTEREIKTVHYLDYLLTY